MTLEIELLFFYSCVISKLYFSLLRRISVNVALTLLEKYSSNFLTADFYMLPSNPNLNRCDGEVVKASASQSVDLEIIS